MQEQTGTAGAVNFDSGLVKQEEMQAAMAVEAKPNTEQLELGNARILGDTKVDTPSEEPKVLIHSIVPAIHLTINVGLPFLKGRKELKSVVVESDNETVKLNLYNPFMRADKDRNTGEGVLRKAIGSIAKITHSVFGKEVVYIGPSGSDLDSSVRDLAKSLCKRLMDQFPLDQDDVLFTIPLTVDGEQIERPVTFSELFTVTSWVSDYTDDEAGVITHVINFNIGMNIGAVYDSTEPHTFVRRTVTFLQNQLQSLGLSDVLEHHVNFAFSVSALSEVYMRDALEILVEEDGFSVVAKSGIESMGFPPEAADALFGYGCDVMLMSPDTSRAVEEDKETE